MPEFVRPQRAIIIEGGADAGGLVLIAAGIAAAAAVVLFIAAHLALLAAVAAVFVAVMTALIVAMRRAASPRRFTVNRLPATAPPAVRVISVTRPRAIEAPVTLRVQRAGGDHQPANRTK